MSARREPVARNGYPPSVHVPLEDAVQAVVAALLFGEDAGLEALAAFQRDQRVIPKLDCDKVTVYPGARNSVVMSVGARNLLAQSQYEAHIRGTGIRKPSGATRYDLTEMQESGNAGPWGDRR